MIVLPRLRANKASSFKFAQAGVESPQQQQLSNALSLLSLNLQKGCSSVVYPASDVDRSSDDSKNKPGSSRDPSSPSPSSSVDGSTSESPVAAAPSSPGGNKPHKSNDGAWESVQALKSADGSLALSQFRLLQRVGGGDIGNVFLAELVDKDYRFAVKIMDKEQLMSRNKLARITNEREILEALDHPFLPTLYGFFETSEYAFLVMDFCSGGDLHKLRQRELAKRFEEDAVRFYAAEALLAIEYLHMMGVVYRDLKPENVLVREDGHIMLTDFDLSLQFDASPSMLKRHQHNLFKPSCIMPNNLEPFMSCTNPAAQAASCVSVAFKPPKFFRRSASLPKAKRNKQQDSSLTRSSSSMPQLNVEPIHVRSMSFVGTHEYLAPEIIAGGGHGSAVDWWTLGIFIYELLFGQTPFKGANNDATLMNAFSKQLNFPDIEVSHSAKDLIRSLLVKDPRKRLGFSRGAAEIRRHPFFEDINFALIRCTPPPIVPKPFKVNDASLAKADSTISEANSTDPAPITNATGPPDTAANDPPDTAANDPNFECF